MNRDEKAQWASIYPQAPLNGRIKLHLKEI